jgi:Flp pilus assembly protein TadD
MKPWRHVAACAVVIALLGCAHGRATPERTPGSEASAQLAPETLASRGLSLMRQGDYLRAEQYLQLALRAGHPEHPLIVPLLTTCIASSRFRAALMHADRHLALHPAAWRVRFVRAAVLRALGQSEHAEIERAQALRDAPAAAHARLAEGSLP